MPKTAISRRTLLTVLAGAGTAALVGCDPETTTAARVPDGLLVTVRGGLGVLRGERRQVLTDAVASPDGATVYATEADGADTAFWRVDTASGEASARVRLPGRWLPQAVSSDGRTVALSSTNVNATSGRPPGRDATTVLIADATGRQDRLDLPGNFVPEAFTGERDGLFVLQWLPSAAPDRYRVRIVDLATKTPGPLLTRLKSPVPVNAEEEMRGDGRQAVLSPNRTVLYTLYTHQPDHQHTRDLIAGHAAGREVHAFVHTLSLAERWAYCIDLPHPFGENPAGGHAMALHPDGRRLWVADLASGAVAQVNAGVEELTVERTAVIPGRPGAAYAAAGLNRLYLASGTSVRVLDPATLYVTADWEVPEAVTGLVLSRDGSRLHIGQKDAVSWYDTESGAQLGRVAFPGLVGLAGLAGA